MPTSGSCAIEILVEIRMTENVVYKSCRPAICGTSTVATYHRKRGNKAFRVIQSWTRLQLSSARMLAPGVCKRKKIPPISTGQFCQGSHLVSKCSRLPRFAADFSRPVRVPGLHPPPSRCRSTCSIQPQERSVCGKSPAASSGRQHCHLIVGSEVHQLYHLSWTPLGG